MWKHTPNRNLNSMKKLSLCVNYWWVTVFMDWNTISSLGWPLAKAAIFEGLIDENQEAYGTDKEIYIDTKMFKKQRSIITWYERKEIVTRAGVPGFSLGGADSKPAPLTCYYQRGIKKT